MNKCKCSNQSIKVAVCGSKHIKDQMILLFGNLSKKFLNFLLYSNITYFNFSLLCN